MVSFLCGAWVSEITSRLQLSLENPGLPNIWTSKFREESAHRSLKATKPLIEICKQAL